LPKEPLRADVLLDLLDLLPKEEPRLEEVDFLPNDLLEPPNDRPPRLASKISGSRKKVTRAIINITALELIFKNTLFIDQIWIN
jgi:hypothetical protein